MMNRAALLSPELHQLLRAAVDESDVFYTLGSSPAANVVSNVSEAGFFVQTEAAQKKGNPPQRVPAWMLQAAWDRLTQTGLLTNKQLLEELKVMRSSVVCAVLARLPGVLVRPGPGIALVYKPEGGQTP